MKPSHQSLAQALRFLKVSEIPYTRSLLMRLALEFDKTFAEGVDSVSKIQGLLRMIGKG